MIDKNLTFEELEKALSYNPETGEFHWKIKIGKKFKVGDKAGTDCAKMGRSYIGFRGSRYKAHRLAWLLTYKRWPDGVIDHINGNPLDNRINNLRDVSSAINQQNQRAAHSQNKSGYLGVDFHKYNGKYRATITLSGKQKHIGYFTTAEEAHTAYLAAKRTLHEGFTS